MLESADPVRTGPPPTAAALEVDTVVTGESTTLLLVGELDLGTADILADCSEKAVADQPPAIVVDLAALSYCDSAGIRVLLSIAARGARDGISVRVHRAQPQIRRVFELTSVVEALDLR